VAPDRGPARAERRARHGADRYRPRHPEGYAGFVQPRSGLALRHGVTCSTPRTHRLPATRDELRRPAREHDPEVPYRVRRGDRIASSCSSGWTRPGSSRSPRWTGPNGASTAFGSTAGDPVSRLTGLDGAFLALESPTTHLHILGAMVFDPDGVPGGLGFRRIRSWSPSASPWCRLPHADGRGSLRPAAPDARGGPRLRPRLPRAAGQPAGAGWCPPSSPSWWPTWLAPRSTAAGRCGSSMWWRAWRTVGSASWQGPPRHHRRGLGCRDPGVVLRPLRRSRSAPPVRCGPPRHGGWALRCGRARGDRRARGPDPGEGVVTPGPPGEFDQLKQSIGGLPGQLDSLVRSIARTVQTATGRQHRNREVLSGLPPALFQAPPTSINRADSRRTGGWPSPTATRRGPAGGRRVRRHRQRRRPGRDGRGPAGPCSRPVGRSPRRHSWPSCRCRCGRRPNRVPWVPGVGACSCPWPPGWTDPAARLRHIRDGVRAAKEQNAASTPRCSPRGPRRRSPPSPPACPDS